MRETTPAGGGEDPLAAALDTLWPVCVEAIDHQHPDVELYALTDYRVLYRAPAETVLEVGDTVTGSRAVSAPAGTTLRCTTAAVVAIRTVNGWYTAPAFPDPEHHVPSNTWRSWTSSSPEGS